MKIFNSFTVLLAGVLALSACKHEPLQGETFGQEFEQAQNAVSTLGPYGDLALADTLQTQMIGEITEVCQNKGCWMKVTLGSKDEVMVRFKDYGFFVPKDAAGRKVIMNGAAFLEEMSVGDQRHYAEDHGDSPEEIAQITSPKRTYRFEAEGVLIAN